MLKNGLSIIFALLFLPFLAMSQPKLDFEGGRMYDWGDVKPKDSPLKAKIKLYNKGNEVLKITDIKASCGCTVPKLDKDELAPNDSTILNITLNIKESDTKIQKSITFTTNVPGNEKYVYFIKANVKPAYRLEPRNINFFNIELGKEAISKVILTNTGTENIVIDSLKVEPNYMITNLSKGLTIKPSESFTIECKVVAKKTENFYPRINLYIANHSDIQKIDIFGYARAKTADSEQEPQNSKPLPVENPNNMNGKMQSTPTEQSKPVIPKTEAPQAPKEQTKPTKK